MQAIKEILDIKSDQIVINVPPNFHQTRVEVIVLALDTEHGTERPFQENEHIDYENFFGITNIGTETLDNYLNSIRAEWERYVFD